MRRPHAPLTPAERRRRSRIGYAIWKARTERRLGQQEASILIGVSVVTLARWEIGARDPREWPECVRPLCRVFPTLKPLFAPSPLSKTA